MFSCLSRQKIIFPQITISAGEEGVTFTRLEGDRGSDDNRITNNRIDAISPAGFYIQNATDEVSPKFTRSLETPVDEIPVMVLTSNTTTSAGGDTGLKPDPSPPRNTWNLSITEGPNIAGGRYLGGNYWEDPTGNGFSQTHPDRGDGFCNESYVLGKGNTITCPSIYIPQNRLSMQILSFPPCRDSTPDREMYR